MILPDFAIPSRLFVYYEARKREVEWGTGTPKDREIETRLIDERFVSVMGECVI